MSVKKLRFPLSQCKKHNFCYSPQPENYDSSISLSTKDLIDQSKPYHQRQIIEQNMYKCHPQELNLNHLRKVSPNSDQDSEPPLSRRLITEQCLADWCQKSINLKFDPYQVKRPFLMPPKIHKYLKDASKIIRQNSNQPLSYKQDNLTVEQITQIINRQPTNIRFLTPDKLGEGVPIIVPSQRRLLANRRLGTRIEHLSKVRLLDRIRKQLLEDKAQLKRNRSAISLTRTRSTTSHRKKHNLSVNKKL